MLLLTRVGPYMGVYLNRPSGRLVYLPEYQGVVVWGATPILKDNRIILALEVQTPPKVSGDS